MKEKRSQDRVRLSNEVDVVDVVSGAHVGLLGNVSAGGMMLITKREFEVGGVSQLRLNLPEAVLGRDHIDVGVECVWAESSTVQGTCFVGFGVVDVDPEEGSVLEALCLP